MNLSELNLWDTLTWGRMWLVDSILENSAQFFDQFDSTGAIDVKMDESVL